MTLNISHSTTKEPHSTSTQTNQDPSGILERLNLENVVTSVSLTTPTETKSSPLKKRASLNYPEGMTVVEVDFETDEDTTLRRKKSRPQEISENTIVEENSERKLLNQFVESFCKDYYSLEEFFKLIEENKFEIDNPDISSLFFKNIYEAPIASELRNKVITEFLCELSHKNEISEESSIYIYEGLKKLKPQELIEVMTKRGTKFSHYSWSQPEEKHIPADFFVPLFLTTNFKRISTKLIDELINFKNFDLLMSLLYCKSQKNKDVVWMQTPFGMIESFSLVEWIKNNHPNCTEIQELLNSKIGYFNALYLSPCDFFLEYQDFNDFKMRLESTENNSELLSYVHNVLESHYDTSRPPIPLRPFGLFYLIPSLIEVVNEDDLDDLNSLVDFLLSKTQDDKFVVLSDEILFKLSLPLFEALIQSENFKLVDALLSAKQNSGNTPLFDKKIFELSIPLLQQLVNCGQFDIIKKMLSEVNDNGDSCLHYNLKLAAPLLAKLVQLNQIELIRDLLTLTNFCEKTPFHTCENIFKTTTPILEELLQRRAFNELQHFFSKQDENGILPIGYNNIDDMINGQYLLIKLVNMQQYELVHHFLLTPTPSEKSILFIPKIFISLFPVIDSLVENDQFGIVENLLSLRNSSGKTLMHFSSHFEMFDKLLKKLEIKGQTNLVQRLKNLAFDINNLGF